jgi:hypothetical protein
MKIIHEYFMILPKIKRKKIVLSGYLRRWRTYPQERVWNKRIYNSTTLTMFELIYLHLNRIGCKLLNKRCSHI